MAQRLTKGLGLAPIPFEEVELEYTDGKEFFQFLFQGTKEGTQWETTYDDGYMVCTCPDFFNRGGYPDMGSFLCNHCIKALDIIFKIRELGWLVQYNETPRPKEANSETENETLPEVSEDQEDRGVPDN